MKSLLLIVALAGAAAHAAEQPVRVPVTRDLWLSAVGSESDANLGGADRLKLKSIQEFSLIDFDPAALKGRVILKATLHVKVAGERLRRVSACTFASEWFEGTNGGYSPQQGSSCYNRRKFPDEWWAFPGSNLNAVTLGNGGTMWRMAEATDPDAQGRQTIAVDPIILMARVAGVSHGILLFDDTGSEWTRDGEKFNFRHFPNRFIHSREAGRDRVPYLLVELGETDTAAPPAPIGLIAKSAGLPPGEAEITWKTPTDVGKAGTVGFLVEANGKAVPRYEIPAAAPAGRTVKLRLRDMGFGPGEKVTLTVKAVDGAGNVGPAASATFTTSAEKPLELPAAKTTAFTAAGPLPKLGDAEVAILDPLDKVHPVTGSTIPEQPAEYLAANHLFSAAEGRIRLHAARNEFVGFQILFRGAVDKVEPSLALPVGKASFARYAVIPTGAGPLGDPIVDLSGPFSVPTPEDKAAGQKNGSLLCELYVPHNAPAGDHAGTLKLTAGGKTLELKVTLTVWNFTLPDHLSFYPEMNCYGLPGGETAWYRLAQKHRTVLNSVPYSQRGFVSDGWAPKPAGKGWDWAAWDARFGPLFDGSAFADLPRGKVPLECFYMPVNENWPTPIEGNYNHSFWADQAFPATYRKALTDFSKEMADHLSAKGWADTKFQFFLNGKNNFKEKGWSRGSSPWLLDEPANFQDYWALKWFGDAFHEGIRQGATKAQLCYRCDISRPEWQRDTLDAVLDYNVVAGGPFMQYHRLVSDRKADFNQMVIVYGGTNAPEASNMQPLGWSLDVWSRGGDGVLPWLAVGTDRSWQKGEDTCVLYPGKAVGLKDPVPSIRLKAYTRGQQDVEYLTLFTQLMNRPRWAVGEAVRTALKLKGSRQGTGAAGEDPGVIVFKQLRPQDAWALRVRVGEFLSSKAPPAKAKLVDFTFPRRDLSLASPGHAR